MITDRGGAAGRVGGVRAGRHGAVRPVWGDVVGGAGGGGVVDLPLQGGAGVEPAGHVVVPTLSHLITLNGKYSSNNSSVLAW